MDDLIAKTTTRAISPLGVEFLGAIGVGAPVQQKTGEYGCAVVLPPDYDSKMIFGADSLQSLLLALRLVAVRLDELMTEGWKFLYPDSDVTIPFGAYLVHPEFIATLEGIGRQAEQDARGNRRQRPS